MTHAFAVIGANYGDEGKGLITDYLARMEDADFVIRFNGGAQAGHTVVTSTKRRVFKHLGAGTLARVPTVLSEHFISNPILFNQELKDNPKAEVLVDHRSLVTTPYDMLMNQAVERARHARHGSCGVGINETVTRSLVKTREQADPFAIRVKDLADKGFLKLRLELIRAKYIPYRAEELGLTPEQCTEVQASFSSSELIDGFIEEAAQFLKNVKVIKSLKRLQGATVIFEGAQGLGLDEFAEGFPHVTRSRTGLTNVIELANELHTGFRPVYVTRAYLTRHGAGPLLGELPDKPYPDINELTNVTNEHQGRFRYAHLDITGLVHRIRKDLPRIKLDPIIAVTCMDQVPELIYANQHHSASAETIMRGSFIRDDLPIYLKRELDFDDALISTGPTAYDVRAV